MFQVHSSEQPIIWPTANRFDKALAVKWQDMETVQKPSKTARDCVQLQFEARQKKQTNKNHEPLL